MGDLQLEPSDDIFLKEKGLVHITDYNFNNDFNNQILAISNKFGVLFAATSTGLAFTNTSYAIDAAARSREKKEIGKLDAKNVNTVSLEVIRKLSISKDELALAAACGSDIHIFELQRLLKVIFCFECLYSNRKNFRGIRVPKSTPVLKIK